MMIVAVYAADAKPKFGAGIGHIVQRGEIAFPSLGILTVVHKRGISFHQGLGFFHGIVSAKQVLHPAGKLHDVSECQVSHPDVVRGHDPRKHLLLTDV